MFLRFGGINGCWRPGETCTSISKEYSYPLETIKKLNPDLNCEPLQSTVCKKLKTMSGDAPFTQEPRTPICVDTYKPQCEWWVQTNTTSCTELVAQYAPQMAPLYNLDFAEFVQLNDDVKSDACVLNVGQEVR